MGANTSGPVRRLVLIRIGGAVAGLVAVRRTLAPTAVRADTARPTAAAAVPDWDVPGGHFYTQGATGEAGDRGFTVLDSGGAPFWSGYRALGGPAQLGFPVSERFEWDAQPYQATETALLGWDAGGQRVEVAPVFALLADLGADEWLLARGIPAAAAPLRERPGPGADVRLTWLTHPVLRSAFAAAGEAAGAARYGLPMGEPERFGPYLAQRFEKAVLQLWLDDVPGQPPAGTVSLVQVGPLLGESGLAPADAFAPQPPPAPRPAPPPDPPLPAAPPLPAGARAATPPAALADGTHVVVSVRQQWWYAYQDRRLLYDGPVTTGQPELFTPTGDFAVLSRYSPYTFVSPWPPGSKYWYSPSPTTYALRITDTGVFLHDAPWRPYYGPGTNVPHRDPDGVWRTGSHGCINMPYAAARWLWGFAPVGTPVHVVG